MKDCGIYLQVPLLFLFLRWFTSNMACFDNLTFFSFFFSRCVSVCCADMLTGPTIHLSVYPGINLPILPKKTQAQRFNY